MFKLMDKKITAILRKLFLLIWPYGNVYMNAYTRCFRYRIKSPPLNGRGYIVFDVGPISFGMQDCVQDSHELVGRLEPNFPGYNIGT